MSCSVVITTPRGSKATDRFSDRVAAEAHLKKITWHWMERSDPNRPKDRMKADRIDWKVEIVRKR
jgi:hypothetical protein